MSMKTKFDIWLDWFDEHLVWRAPDSGIRGIRDPFELDADALLELHSCIDELNHFVVHLENTYSETDEKYNDLIERILEAYKTISISWMEDFTITDSSLYEFVTFDEEDRFDEILQDNPDAYDENLDRCVKRAMSDAHEEYCEMRFNIEEDVLFLRDQIEKVIQFLDRAHSRTLEYANKWIAQKVDNT